MGKLRDAYNKCKPTDEDLIISSNNKLKHK